jgi:hypothetical protein
MTIPKDVRSKLHLKYQVRFKLSEHEMRWCEMLSAFTLKPLTLVITQYAITRENIRK